TGSEDNFSTGKAWANLGDPISGRLNAADPSELPEDLRTLSRTVLKLVVPYATDVTAKDRLQRASDDSYLEVLGVRRPTTGNPINLVCLVAVAGA
ncbi:MAG: hypothetical protein ABL962_18865, partial [Fimbriimonadaceae bacterium]